MIFIIKYNELVMKKNRIRLTESQLHKVIKESIQTLLNETSYDTSKRAFKKAGEKLLSIPYNDKNAFKKAQKQYNSDIFGFGRIIEIQNPKLWKAIGEKSEGIFENVIYSFIILLSFWYFFYNLLIQFTRSINWYLLLFSLI